MSKRNRAERPAALTSLIRERISILLSLAEKELKPHPKRSRRYVSLARKLSRRYNVRLPRTEKMRFCKKCGMPLVAGITASVRLNAREGFILYHCRCGNTTKVPYKSLKKSPKHITFPTR